MLPQINGKPPLLRSSQLSRIIHDLRLAGHMAQHITPARLINAAKVLSSYYYSLRTGKPQLWGQPFSISVEPTTACNLRCPECPSGLRSFTRPTGKLGLELMEKMLEELGPNLLYLLLYFQGEPYLHPQFFELLALAKKHKVFTATSTNAHFLNSENARKTVESGLGRLIVSIDGTTQRVYSQYRKTGKLAKVIEGTNNLLHWRKKLKSASPQVIFQFLVVKPNEHQIPEVLELGKKLGVDEVRLKTAQIYDYKNGNPLIPTQLKYSRYRPLKNGQWEVKHSLDNGCWKMWHSCVMTWDGRIVPCCFDKDAEHNMGSLTSSSFSSIWQGEAYQQFRQQLFKGRSQIDICRNCTEGCSVWK